MEVLDHAYLADLVVKTQKGSSNAFAELYAATYQRQYSYSARYLSDEHLAQDAMQETYIRALRNISKLQNPTLFIAWLNHINFNVCHDMYDKSRRDISMPDEEIEALGNAVDRARIPEDEVVEVDSTRYILEQVMALPITESQAIIMRYYQGMKLDEIADALNMSRSSVKRYLRSGKAHLRRTII